MIADRVPLISGMGTMFLGKHHGVVERSQALGQINLSSNLALCLLTVPLDKLLKSCESQSSIVKQGSSYLISRVV